MPETAIARLTKARENLQNAVDNALWDLGEIGRAKAADILSEIQDELDIEDLIEEPEDV